MHQRGPLSSGRYVPRCVPHADVTSPPATRTFSVKTSAARNDGQPCSSVSALKSFKSAIHGRPKER